MLTLPAKCKVSLEDTLLRGGIDAITQVRRIIRNHPCCSLYQLLTILCIDVHGLS